MLDLAPTGVDHSHHTGRHLCEWPVRGQWAQNSNKGRYPWFHYELGTLTIRDAEVWVVWWGVVEIVQTVPQSR